MNTISSILSLMLLPKVFLPLLGLIFLIVLIKGYRDYSQKEAEKLKLQKAKNCVYETKDKISLLLDALTQRRDDIRDTNGETNNAMHQLIKEQRQFLSQMGIRTKENRENSFLKTNSFFSRESAPYHHFDELCRELRKNYPEDTVNVNSIEEWHAYNERLLSFFNECKSSLFKQLDVIEKDQQEDEIMVKEAEEEMKKNIVMVGDTP